MVNTRAPDPTKPRLMTIDQAITAAYGHWNAGQLLQAEMLCQQVLKVWPEQADALHLLGLLAHTNGNRAVAIDYLRRACASPSAPALFLSNLAEIYRQDGRLAEGEAAARRATARDGRLVAAWTNLGIILQEVGKLEESLTCLERVVGLTPNNPQARNNLANTLQRLGRYEEAEQHYQAVIALAPSYAEARNNLAHLLKKKGEYGRAMAELKRAIEINPQYHDAYINAAGTALARGEPAEALFWLDSLAGFAPNSVAGLTARARVLLATNDLMGAERAVRTALAAAPENEEPREVLALILEAANRSEAMSAAHGAAIVTEMPGMPPVGLGSPPPTIVETERLARQELEANRPEKAEILLRATLAGGEGPLQVWALLAAALRRQGKIEEARALQEHLVDLVPQNVELRFNLAESLLLLGEFDRGWREYRFRYSLPHTVTFERKLQMPRWEGQRIDGKTLLIHDEQGFGDTLQFLRLVPWAKARSGARVVLQISLELLPFARRMKGIDDLVVRGELPPHFDLHCEMMSLPMAMGLKLADLPGEVPYLSADPVRLKRWRRRLTGLPRPRVALVWAGRPEHLNDANRSVSLATLAGLATKGVTFLSVQKGPKAIEARLPPTGFPILDLSEEIKNFDDTAAILSQVDLLISVDSSPVHLAGALGRPAWVMLPFVPDWRWLMGRSDTPWYPSVRLFRQKIAGEWGGVIQEMAQELARLWGGQNI